MDKVCSSLIVFDCVTESKIYVFLNMVNIQQSLSTTFVTYIIDKILLQ